MSRIIIIIPLLWWADKLRTVDRIWIKIQNCSAKRAESEDAQTIKNKKLRVVYH